MPRRKKTEAADASHTTDTQANAAASTAVTEAPAERPAYIDGPPVNEEGTVVNGDAPAKNWGNPYKAVVTTASFEMGEDRRFKQRVFKFKEKPADDVIATLKDHGFTYRPNEKAWTIPANAETRLLTERLAQDFAGPHHAPSR